MSFFKKYKLLLLQISVITPFFLLYYFTSCRTIFVGDTPELSASIYCNGIAHPPGYPLYTSIAFLATRLAHLFFFNAEFVFLTNLFSGICALLSAFVAFNIFILINKELFKNKENAYYIFFSIITSLYFFTSRTLWEQSVITEVYTFEILIISIYIFLLLKIYFYLSEQFQDLKKNEILSIGKQTNIMEKKGWERKYRTPENQKNSRVCKFSNKNLEKNTENIRRNVLLSGLVFGLAFTHRPTAVLLLISSAVLMINFYKTINIAKTIFYFITGFVCGLFPLFIMIIKSLFDPLMNWGNPSDFNLLIEHFSGKLYHNRFLNLSIDKIFLNLSDFFVFFYNQHSILFIILCSAGIFFLLKNNRKLLAVIGSYQVFLVIYAVNYDIPDINAYYIPVYLIMFAYMFCGTVFIYDFFPAKIKLSEKNKIYRSYLKILIKTAFIFLILIGFIKGTFENYRINDISDSRQLEDYIKNIFITVPESSVLVLSGDDLIGSFQYMQIVNKMRKDLIGIALNFDRYEWYYAQLKKRYKNLNMPGYQNNSGNEMTKRVIDANIKNKRITSIFSKEGIIQYYDYTPCGIIGVLSEKGIKQELIYDFSFWSKYKISGFDKYKFGMPIENHTDLRLKNIFESYCNSISNLAVYYLHNNKYSEMEKTLQILNSFDKNFPPQYFIRGAYYYQTGKYNEASENFMKVKNLSPGYENIDELLFKCSKKINKSGE